VEAARVELASEDGSEEATTRLVYGLISDRRRA
jgi:hypothetical protein